MIFQELRVCFWKGEGEVWKKNKKDCQKNLQARNRSGPQNGRRLSFLVGSAYFRPVSRRTLWEIL
jgi:hypothetical protein